MVRTTLRSEFKRVDPLSARIVLVDMANRVLGTFDEKISDAAKQRLERLGVEVRLGKAVEKIDADGIIAGGERIASKTVIWTAGVAPSPAGKWLAVETDRAGRVKVQPDCSVPGHPEIFVVGDTASIQQDGKPLPGVAQVAMQGGRYVGKLIARRLSGKAAPRPFRYFDKGNMAVVGRGFAIMQSGKIHLSGFFAWLAWAAIHIQFLATANLRISVFVQWVWTFLTGQRGSRLIVNHHASANEIKPEPSAALSGGEPPMITSWRAITCACLSFLARVTDVTLDTIARRWHRQGQLFCGGHRGCFEALILRLRCHEFCNSNAKLDHPVYALAYGSPGCAGD
jgi:hypothetical protein